MWGRFIVISILGLWYGGCIPTSGRKNAQISPGVNLEVIGGAQWLDEGVDEDGMPTEPSGMIYLEADLQWGKALANDSGVAIQLKVPWSIVYSMLDLYYQLPPLAKGLYVGVGGELGGFHGVYAAGTYYLGDKVFLTATPRFLRVAGSENADGTVTRPASFQYSGQLALGFKSSDFELAAFLMVAHQTGDGFDLQPFGDGNEDLRTDYGLLGLSIRR